MEVCHNLAPLSNQCSSLFTVYDPVHKTVSPLYFQSNVEVTKSYSLEDVVLAFLYLPRKGYAILGRFVCMLYLPIQALNCSQADENISVLYLEIERCWAIRR